MWNDLKPAYRFPVLILGMLSLIIGILAGAGRLGTPVAQIALDQMAYHGILMIPAFFGTVIGLERAVAIAQRWAYLAPLLTGIGGVTIIAGATPGAALFLLFAGSIIFTLASIQVLRTQYAVHNWILLAGASCLVTGNFVLLNESTINTAIYWWMSFLLLTIAGERLELSRLVIRSNGKRILLAVLTSLPIIGAAIISIPDTIPGTTIFSLGLASIAVWLLAFDIARRTVLLSGLTRFTAVCMLTGYLWLLTSAILLIGYEFGWEHISRDAALHSFFLGFVFSMVIGHALIIFPAVTELKIPYSPVIYLPFTLLQISLMVRLLASFNNNSDLLRHAGTDNAIALALFIAVLVWRIITGLVSNRSGKHII